MTAEQRKATRQNQSSTKKRKKATNTSTRGIIYVARVFLTLTDGLPDEWDKTAEMLKKIAETVLGVTFGNEKGIRRQCGGMRKFRRA